MQFFASSENVSLSGMFSTKLDKSCADVSISLFIMDDLELGSLCYYLQPLHNSHHVGESWFGRITLMLLTNKYYFTHKFEFLPKCSVCKFC